MSKQVQRKETRPTVNLPPLGHFIGGKFQDNDRIDTIKIINPSTGEELGTIPSGSESVLTAALESAKSAFPSWASKTPAERSSVLLELAQRLADHSEEFEALESLDCGKPRHVASDDIGSAIDTLRFMAGAGRTGSTIPAGEYVEDVTSIILREPLGVVGLITPWNYPLLMAIWKIAPALMMGNTAVLKPSEVTPLTALKFAEITADVLPPGVLNVVLGTGEEIGAAMSGNPDFAMVAVTGSVRAGRAVAQAAAQNITRVHLELGGKAPVIVFDDADIEEVVATISEAGLWNSGQECGAACRVLVHETCVEELSTKLTAAFSEFVLAEPGAGGEDSLGPMIYGGHFDRVMNMIGQAKEEGAEVLIGGNGTNTNGYWIEPTVLKVKSGTTITREEVFGPVVSIETFTQEAEAIERANDVDYGLIASVFTKDMSRALRVSKKLDFGSVNVNTHLALPTEMPWSGFKKSGYGRDLSAYALDDYSRTKHLALKH